MRATATQRAAYHALDESAKRTQNQMVLDLFVDAATKLTRHDIAARTNLPMGSVCRVVRVLIDAGKLAVRGLQRCAASGLDNEAIGLSAAN